MTTAELQKLLTTNDLQAIFRRNAMTIYLWRRDRGLSTIEIDNGKRPLVRFDWEVVKAWYESNREWLEGNNVTFNEVMLKKILDKRHLKR